MWTGRALNSREPDIHHFGSIKTELHQGVPKLFSFLMFFSEE